MKSSALTERAKCLDSLQPSAEKFFALAVVAVLMTAAGSVQTSEKNAGLLHWSFTYHNASVPVAVWYPTNEATTTINAGPFTLTAASNAQLPDEKHPLLVLSHGTGGSNIAHHPVAEILAAAGFMVAALTHPGDNYQDRSLLADERYFGERPRQLAALLDAIIHDKKLAAFIDTDRIGAIGHSVGAYTVAVQAGAKPDRKGLLEHCDRVDDDPSCNYRDPTLGVTSATTDPFILPINANDAMQFNTPSIKSIALLAPLGSAISAASRIDQNISVKVITAELDNVLPHHYHRDRIRQIAPHGVFSDAAGAGHFSFIAPVNDDWQQSLGAVAKDPAELDRLTFNLNLGHELTEWFSKTLASVND